MKQAGDRKGASMDKECLCQQIANRPATIR